MLCQLLLRPEQRNPSWRFTCFDVVFVTCACSEPPQTKPSVCCSVTQHRGAFSKCVECLNGHHPLKSKSLEKVSSSRTSPQSNAQPSIYPHK